MIHLENKDLEKNIELLISNAFINSPFKYTQIELDIVFMIITMLTKGEDTYVISLSQLKNITGRRYRSDVIFKETKQLMSRVYTVIVNDSPKLSESVLEDVETESEPDNLSLIAETDNGDGDMYINDEQAFFSYCLFSSIYYRQGVITAKLTENAIHLFEHAKERYTHLTLKYALLLTNKYAKRLYMLLSQWVFVGEKKYSFEELRRLLTPTDPSDTNSEDNSYKAASDFKKVVESAVSDINRITELSVSTTYNKHSRSLNSITFGINKNSDLKIPLGQSEVNFNNSVEKNEFIGLCKHYSLTDSQAMEMWDRGCRKSDFKKVMKDINRTCMKNPGSIKNLDGYIVVCFANAGYLNIDKSSKDLNKAKRNSKKKQKLEEREHIVNMIRQSLAGGADITAFNTFIENYHIQSDELQ